MNLPYSTLLKHLWSKLSFRRKKQYFLLFLLMFLSTLAEMISLGAVLPFFGVLTIPEEIFSSAYMQPIISFFGIQEAEGLLLPVTVIFASAALFSGIIRVFQLFITTRLTYATGVDLSLSIYQRTLHQPYSVHISRNNSEVIDGIIKKTDSMTSGVLLSCVTLLSSIIMLIGLVATLLYIDPFITSLSFIGFLVSYLIVLQVTNKRLARNGLLIAKESIKVIKNLQEGLGGIRDILINKTQNLYGDLYYKSDQAVRYAVGNNAFVGGSPRFIMESIAIILISILALSLTKQSGGITSAIPLLGTIVLGAQRLLPVLQQIYLGITSLRVTRSSLIDVLELLDQPLPDENSEKEPSEVLPFEKVIKLNNVTYAYPNEQMTVLDEINIEISKGDAVGIIGSTGSGKSTLIDLFMGLLDPNTGTLEIDKSIVSKNNINVWHSYISHVPQHIYLADISLKENIAFGLKIDDIDMKYVYESAKKAQIHDFIESLPQKYNTLAGEVGTRLSGGQRQRIGIARALYKRAKVIIFDEATSALDDETEEAVMQSIESLEDNLTKIIIAHRLSTLKKCNKIFEMESGRIINSGSYDDLVKIRSPENNL